jgi:hypothetical protein
MVVHRKARENPTEEQRAFLLARGNMVLSKKNLIVVLAPNIQNN